MQSFVVTELLSWKSWRVKTIHRLHGKVEKMLRFLGGRGFDDGLNARWCYFSNIYF